MIMRVLLAAIIAGLMAGTIASAFQIWRVTPLILAAEVYENQPAVAEAQSSAPAGATEEAQSWAPEDGIERTAYTVLTNSVMGVGFAFILAAAVMFTGRSITLRNGVLWGLAGFITFTLAPAAGLAPELPGLPAADLVTRQIWWWGTVAATAGGIGLIALQDRMALKAVGVALIAVPHIIGAPHPANIDSAVPAVLAAGFAANTLAMMALFWIVLGVSMGWSLNRPGARAET
jgi:cobalt transporter subunit CbtA